MGTTKQATDSNILKPKQSSSEPTASKSTKVPELPPIEAGGEQRTTDRYISEDL